MARYGITLAGLSPVVLALLFNAGCSGSNLGDFDDSNTAREEMPGPGIFTDENGESALTWSRDSKEPESTSATSSAATTTSTATATAATASPEQAEFEQFKAWNELRNNGAESAEYQEFLQWLEYQKFKSGQ